MLARYWLADDDALRPLLDFATRPFAAPEAGPHVDILETEAGVEFVAEVPGATPEDVTVTLDNGRLTLQTRRRAAAGRPRAAFTRAFPLSDRYDPDQISASLQNGLLTVHVAKKPAATPKKIPIQFRAAAPAAPPLGATGEGAAPRS